MVWGAPGPWARQAVPAGWGCWSGRHYTPVAWGSLSQFRSQDPPTQPRLGGAHKAPLFLPWNEWIGGSRDRLSATDTGDPAGQAEERGTGEGTDGRMDRADAEIAGLAGLAPVPAGGCGTGSSTGWGLGTSSHLHHASPGDVPVSPGDAHTALRLQQPVLAPRWCYRTPGPAPCGMCGAGTGVLALYAGMASWQIRSCSRFPSWKKPLQGAGRGCCRIQAASVHPHSWGSSSADLPHTQLPL